MSLEDQIEGKQRRAAALELSWRPVPNGREGTCALRQQLTQFAAALRDSRAGGTGRRRR